MNISILRVGVLAAFAALVLAGCGQKGALMLPDASGASPIVIRESQPTTPPAGNTAPDVAATPAPPVTPANPATPANPTPPQR